MVHLACISQIEPQHLPFKFHKAKNGPLKNIHLLMSIKNLQMVLHVEKGSLQI